MIGSLKSSPSTSTVYNPVIDPLSEVPARSNSFGISEYTLGGYPQFTGVLRMQVRSRAVPWKNVSGESIIRSTSFLIPEILCNGYRRHCAFLRINAGLSEVATTTMERFLTLFSKIRSSRNTCYTCCPLSTILISIVILYLL